MECKYLYIKPATFCTKELIDTLWNVNGTINSNSPTLKYELIDTLWNVNIGVLPEIASL